MLTKMLAQPAQWVAVRRHAAHRFALALSLVCLGPSAGLVAQTAAYVDVSESVGIDFVHEAGETGDYHLPEITGSGLGFFDYDGDGDLDLYAVQAGSSASSMIPGEGAPTNRLYELGGDGKFVDRTQDSGLGDPGYGMGLAVGDIDNDGDIDVYLTNYGSDRLYLNEGGRFRDISESSGIRRADDWSASATLCDIDSDGLLDLYVTRYVRYDPAKQCTQSDGSRDYCSPQVFPGESDRLYRNMGSGKFEDISNHAGLLDVAAPGLGVVCLDFNGDRRLDFYVANDGAANQLWINQGDSRFTDEALLAGAALNDSGQPEAGMGIAVSDLDEDGSMDLLITHIGNETNTLYMNNGVDFEDATTRTGLAAPSLTRTGFGTGFVDFDHDGDLDLAIANGRVQRGASSDGAPLAGYWSAYAESDQLMVNVSKQDQVRFDDFAPAGGDFVRHAAVGRGLAIADFDEDGDLDLAVANTDAPLRVYRNSAEKKGHWLSVSAYDERLKRHAHGAVVIAVIGDRRVHRTALAGFGFLATHDPRAHFGFAASESVSAIEIGWPDGSREVFASSQSNRAITLVKGSGQRLP